MVFYRYFLQKAKLVYFAKLYNSKGLIHKKHLKIFRNHLFRSNFDESVSSEKSLTINTRQNF